MKNALFYYYHLYPETLINHHKEYHFIIQKQQYRLLPYLRPLEELPEITTLNKLLTQQLPKLPQIIKNQMGEYLTLINHKFYILMKDPLPQTNLTLEHVLDSQNNIFLPTSFKLINRQDWSNLWMKKIDYFEYQKHYIKNKYPHLYNSLDYYIGLAENGISLLNDALNHPKLNEKEPLIVQRRRVSSDMSLFDYYCPLNLVIDHKARDVAEYLKSLFLHDYYKETTIEKIIKTLPYSAYQFTLLMARLLFPSFYFDCYEKIVNDILPETEIIPILEKSDDYEYFLQFIYITIQNKVTIPRIDWLEHRH